MHSRVFHVPNNRVLILTVEVWQSLAQEFKLNKSSTTKLRKMINQMTIAGIPTPVKIFTWILIGAGSFFFYVYTFNPVLSFPNANLDTYSAKMGFASTGVRILGSVLALLISVVANNPRWLFITLVSRIFIELGDVVVGLTLDGATANTFSLTVLAGIEIWAALRLWKIIETDK